MVLNPDPVESRMTVNINSHTKTLMMTVITALLSLSLVGCDNGDIQAPGDPASSDLISNVEATPLDRSSTQSPILPETTPEEFSKLFSPTVLVAAAPPPPPPIVVPQPSSATTETGTQEPERRIPDNSSSTTPVTVNPANPHSSSPPSQASPKTLSEPSKPSLGAGVSTTIYMSPTGQGNGLDSPVSTFSQAFDVAWKNNGSQAGNITINFEPGEYYLSTFQFTKPLNGNTITLVGNGAVFHGQGQSKYWLDLAPTGGGNVILENLSIEGYANGVRISGGYEYKIPGQQAGPSGPPLTAYVDGFRADRVGSSYSSGKGFGAVHLQNTANSVVKNSSFKNMASGAGMHAVYAVASQGLIVTSSTFNQISGDAVRFRHDSSGLVARNTFTSAGTYAAISTWYCDSACAKKNGQSYELPSFNISYFENQVSGTPEFTHTVR